PKPVEPHPVGNPSRSPPLHLPVAGSFLEGAVGTQCTHSKLRNSPSFFAATKAPSCASLGEEVGSSSPFAFMRPPGNLAKGMSNVMNVAGTQSTDLPLSGSVQWASLFFAAPAGEEAGLSASPAREMTSVINFNRMLPPRFDTTL